jgi:hypothetical protein
MRHMAAVLAAALAAITATACTGASKPAPLARQAAAPPSPPGNGPAAPSTTRATTTTTGARPTTTVAAPPLPVPARLAPLAAPALAGEGSWVPAGSRLPGGYGVYTALVRPAAGFPESGVAWIDTRATRTALYAGSGQPYGSWPQQYDVAAAQQPQLLAAFNSGFKIYNYDTGWYDQGRAAVPLRLGAASLVIRSDGSATVGDWGGDVGMAPDVTAVRQNLTLLVDHGAPVPTAAYPSDWGAVLGGGIYTWRSAVGVNGGGDLVYAAGPDLSPELLARLMVAAGAVRAMELDINPEWVSFAAFTRAGATITGTNLLPGMYSTPGHYLQPYSRDFFAVFSR